MPKPKECPKCQSEEVMRILYGEPIPDYEYPKDTYFGGCCFFTGENQKWHCGKCRWEWGNKGGGRYCTDDEEED